MTTSQTVTGISSQTWSRYYGVVTDHDCHRIAERVLLTTIEYKIAVFFLHSLYQYMVIPKSVHILLNPLIYNKRCFVLFHIFNPARIVLTAFILNVYFSHLNLMISLKFVIQVVRQVYQKVRC
jgi:hypothetical protein